MKYKVDEALSTIVSAISYAGYSPGKDVFLAIDAASSEFYAGGTYDVDGMRLSAGELMDHYVELTKTHPLISIEDPFFEDDFETTAELTRKIGSKVQIVGDDLFVTNSRRLSKGISEGALQYHLTHRWQMLLGGSSLQPLKAWR